MQYKKLSKGKNVIYSGRKITKKGPQSAGRRLSNMKDITKKVVILNNFSSPYISEAIIVLREYDRKLEGKIIDDAEKIVADYISKNTPVRGTAVSAAVKEAPVKKRRAKPAAKRRMKRKPHITVPVLIALAAAVMAGVFLWLVD